MPKAHKTKPSTQKQAFGSPLQRERGERPPPGTPAPPDQKQIHELDKNQNEDLFMLVVPQRTEVAGSGLKGRRLQFQLRAVGLPRELQVSGPEVCGASLKRQCYLPRGQSDHLE